jgi:hypothetical protein
VADLYRTWLDRFLGVVLSAARASGLHGMAWDSQAPKRLLTGEKGSTSLKPKQPDGSIEKQHLSRLVSRNKKASIPPRLASFMHG